MSDTEDTVERERAALQESIGRQLTVTVNAMTLEARNKKSIVTSDGEFSPLEALNEITTDTEVGRKILQHLFSLYQEANPLDLDEIESTWTFGLGLPWTAGKITDHNGKVEDVGGEAIALTYCTSMDIVHGAGIARIIARAPTDIAALIAEVRRLRALLEPC